MVILHWIIALVAMALTLGAASHALLRKSDSRSALGWVAVCLVFPVAGPILYLLFGVNRVRRSASRLRREIDSLTNSVPPTSIWDAHADTVHTTSLRDSIQALERVGRNILGSGLLGGNCVEPLFNGEEAYPAMLEAIASAQHSVHLASYILATDILGQCFINALEKARQRGVEVRVLVDGLGEKYSWPRASRVLRKKAVSTALFTPPHLFPPELHINLRNHRKILVVDGVIGFTGGMNISHKHDLRTYPARPITDIHFILRGPIVSHLQDTFLDDWFFATKERLNLPPRQNNPTGDCLCRAVINGPDQSHEPLKSLLTGIISAARYSIKIMTPYFLPPRTIISALEAACYRGVDVQIILPAQNNLPFVHWATQHILDNLLRVGVRIAFQPPPFCHTKVLLVDECYTHLGSANLDNRSLRLNFELTLEVLDTLLYSRLERHFTAVWQQSMLITRPELQKRSLPRRMRDAFFWLFSPYL